MGEDKAKEIHSRDSRGRTPLFYAVQKGDRLAVESFLDMGADINCKDYNGFSPLYISVKEGNISLTEFLLQRGANPHIMTNKGETPLHFAQKPEIAQLLIEKGADINNSDWDGYRPVHEAALRGNGQVLELLIEKGANIHQGNNMGTTPLQMAKDERIIQILTRIR